MSGYWHEFKKSTELTSHIRDNHPGCILMNVEWYGPGWYYITVNKEVCNWIIQTRYSVNRVYDLKKQMKELAKELVQARLKEKESV